MLSQLLGGVAQAVNLAYSAGVWTMVEVLRVDARNGHVYLGLAGRDARGRAGARRDPGRHRQQDRAPLRTRNRSLLGSGIKLLVRAKPTLHGEPPASD